MHCRYLLLICFTFLFFHPCHAGLLVPEDTSVSLDSVDYSKVFSPAEKTSFVAYLSSIKVPKPEEQRVLICDLNSDGIGELIFRPDTGSKGGSPFKILMWEKGQKLIEIGEIPECIAVLDEGTPWKYIAGFVHRSDHTGYCAIYRHADGRFRLKETKEFTYSRDEKGTIQVDPKSIKSNKPVQPIPLRGTVDR